MCGSYKKRGILLGEVIRKMSYFVCGWLGLVTNNMSYLTVTGINNISQFVAYMVVMSNII